MTDLKHISAGKLWEGPILPGSCLNPEEGCEEPPEDGTFEKWLPLHSPAPVEFHSFPSLPPVTTRQVEILRVLVTKSSQEEKRGRSIPIPGPREAREMTGWEQLCCYQRNQVEPDGWTEQNVNNVAFTLRCSAGRDFRTGWYVFGLICKAALDNQSRMPRESKCYWVQTSKKEKPAWKVRWFVQGHRYYV